MVHNRLLVIWLSRELVSPITALPCLLGRGPESTCFVLTTVKRGKRTVSVPAFMLRGWKVKVGMIRWRSECLIPRRNTLNAQWG